MTTQTQTRVEQAIERFVDRFIDRDRRDRIKRLLCANAPNRRLQGIQAAERWLLSFEEVKGSRATQGQFFQRLGDVPGVFIDQNASMELGLGEAVAAARGGFGALFVAMDSSLAVLFLEFGPPLLCR